MIYTSLNRAVFIKNALKYPALNQADVRLKILVAKRNHSSFLKVNKGPENLQHREYCFWKSTSGTTCRIWHPEMLLIISRAIGVSNSLNLSLRIRQKLKWSKHSPLDKLITTDWHKGASRLYQRLLVSSLALPTAMTTWSVKRGTGVFSQSKREYLIKRLQPCLFTIVF